jgi:shikimate dehydrogenase
VVSTITGTTRLYSIIGDPVAHVRTPMAFQDYFKAHAVDAVCVPVHIARGDLPRGWAGLKAMVNMDGFIVTAPHKAEAGQLCEKLEGDGFHTKVVNTVRREKDGTYTGTLLDGRGFVRGLLSHGHEVKGRRIFLAGAGGAGTALSFALAHGGAAAITIHNRTRPRGEKLAAAVSKAYPACDVKVGTEDASGHDIAVNATSLGLKPDDGHAFDLASVDASALVAEVVMKPDMTPLLIAAEKRGHRIHFGIHMLNSQLELMMQFFGLAPPSAE